MSLFRAKKYSIRNTAAVVFAVAVFAVCAANSTAQRGGWIWQNPLPQGNPIYSIHFAADKRHGFAVGANDTILHTTDGGFTWERQFLPVEQTLRGVFALDARNAVVVGTRGSIYVTDDGGRDWRKAKVDARDHFYDVAFGADKLSGWAVGTYGRIVHTTDGGKTWTEQAADTTEHLRSV